MSRGVNRVWMQENVQCSMQRTSVPLNVGFLFLHGGPSVMTLLILQRKTNTVWSHLYVEFKTAKLIKIAEWWYHRLYGEWLWGAVGQRVYSSCYDSNDPWGLMCSMVVTDNNTGLCTWYLLWKKILHILSTKQSQKYVIWFGMYVTWCWC